MHCSGAVVYSMLVYAHHPWGYQQCAFFTCVKSCAPHLPPWAAGGWKCQGRFLFPFRHWLVSTLHGSHCHQWMYVCMYGCMDVWMDGWITVSRFGQTLLLKFCLNFNMHLIPAVLYFLFCSGLTINISIPDCWYDTCCRDVSTVCITWQMWTSGLVKSF